MVENEGLKVCMVVIKYYYDDTRVRKYGEALYNAGAQVDVLCVSDQAQIYSGTNSGVRVFAIPIEHRHGSVGRYLFEYGLSFVMFGLQLIRLYLKNRYDIIHVHNVPDFLIFIALIPKLLGAKLILDIHDPMPEFFMAKYQKPESHILVKLIKVEEKISAKVAHTIITVNNTCKDHLVARGIPANKITVIRDIPESELFNRNNYIMECKLPRKHFTLIYPGTITAIYGLDFAVQSLPLLIKKIPNIRLVLISRRDSYVSELLDYANELGVSEYIEFKPYIPRDQLALEYSRADVGILSARSNPILDIGVPGKILEYALMGLPIVAPRLKALDDWFTGANVIMFFESGNINQFVACVLKLFKCPGLREKLVQNMDRAFVNVQSWKKEKDIYFKLLKELLPHKVNLCL